MYTFVRKCKWLCQPKCSCHLNSFVIEKKWPQCLLYKFLNLTLVYVCVCWGGGGEPHITYKTLCNNHGILLQRPRPCKFKIYDNDDCCVCVWESCSKSHKHPTRQVSECSNAIGHHIILQGFLIPKGSMLRHRLLGMLHLTCNKQQNNVDCSCSLVVFSRKIETCGSWLVTPYEIAPLVVNTL